MFTRRTPLNPAKLLKNGHSLTEYILLTIPHGQRHYLKLTDHEYFLASFVFCAVHTEVSSSIPDCKSVTKVTRTSDTASYEYTKASWLVSGWAGLIDYPHEHYSLIKADFRYYPHTLLIDPTQDYCIIQSHFPITDDVVQSYDDIWDALDREPPEQAQSDQPSIRAWQPLWSKDDYQNAFRRVREYLTAGDTYQINLAMPFICNDDLTRARGIELLTAFDAPHGCIIKSKDRSVFSVSPERLLKIQPKAVDGGIVRNIETRPIKGTAPRNDDPHIDKQNADTLVNSAKNQAENLMIVDLLRNDLSVHALSGSVLTRKLFELESHLNVHHLVSTITANLKPEATIADAIRAAFPGGSITGAPKKRATEIIRELEPGPRGAYCGSAGYIDDSGLCDFNILIRTIEAKPEGAVCWGGGGIVMDSDAEDEYQEIQSKVGRILSTPI